MSIENEALAHIASFYVGKLNKLQYKDAANDAGKDRPIYEPSKADLQLRSSAHEMYLSILELKKGKVPDTLSDEAKKQLAEHFDDFTIAGTIGKKSDKIEVFTLTKKIELQLKQRADRELKAAEAAEKAKVVNG